MRKIGEIIRSKRTSVGYSMQDLAVKANMTSAYVSNIENSKLTTPPSEDAVNKIAIALNMTESEKNELLRTAALERTPEIIRKEVELFSEEDLELIESRSYTHLGVATLFGRPKRFFNICEDYKNEINTYNEIDEEFYDHNQNYKQLGFTPLHYAIKRGHKKMISWLIENGADINLRNKYGNPPIFLAFDYFFNDTKLLTWFLSLNPNLSFVAEHGITLPMFLLHLAPLDMYLNILNATDIDTIMNITSTGRTVFSSLYSDYTHIKRPAEDLSLIKNVLYKKANDHNIDPDNFYFYPTTQQMFYFSKLFGNEKCKEITAPYSSGAFLAEYNFEQAYIHQFMYWSDVNETIKTSKRMLYRICEILNVHEFQVDNILSSEDRNLKNKKTKDKSYTSNEVNLSEKLPVVKLPIYGSVSAGNGELVLGEITGYEYSTAHDFIEGSFYLHVKGNSMEPRIPDGALVEVVPCSMLKCGYELKDKDIGVFVLDGDEGIVKQYFRDEDFHRLVSFNSEFRDKIIPFTRQDFHIVGKVVSMKILF